MHDATVQPALRSHEWRPVPGYEGLYQVSSLGKVKSLPRTTTKGGILKPRTDKRGYQWVGLSKDGLVRNFSIHELVALAFFGPRPTKPRLTLVQSRSNLRILCFKQCSTRANSVSKVSASYCSENMSLN